MSIEQEYTEALKKLEEFEADYYVGLKMKGDALNEMNALIETKEMDQLILKKMKLEQLVFLPEINKVQQNMKAKEGHIDQYAVLFKDVAESVKKRKKLVVEHRKYIYMLEQELEGRGKVYEFRKAK
jgi:hypothetical protein